MDITAYDVMRSHVDDEGHNEGDWVLLTHGVEVLERDPIKSNSGVKLGIHHLLPGATYQFRVSARNSLGRSLWSGSSPKTSTIFAPARETVEDDYEPEKQRHGFTQDDGHVVHGRNSGIHGIHLHPGSSYEKEGPIAMLSDEAQTIVVGGIKLDVWSAYYSPRGWKVSGEVAGAQRKKHEMM